MPEPTVGAERRVRTLLAVLDPTTYNLGDEIVYSAAFNSPEWPRTGYALNRPDLEAVLALLDRARSYRLAHPADAVDPQAHTPGRVRAYLAARGWTPCPTLRGTWINDAHPESSLFVHPTASASDYAVKTGILAAENADLEGTGELQILAQIAATDPAAPDA